MKAVIVAGGRGERLKPITNHIPKPMVPVAGRPVLEHTIALLKKHGVRDFIIAVCYLPEKITEYFGDGSKFGVNITYIYEDPAYPLGNAGAIAAARPHIDSTFIVTCSDVLRELNVAEIIEAHKRNAAIATIQAHNVTKEIKSLLEFNENNELVSLQELPATIELEEGSWTNSSFYVLEPEIFDHIPENQKYDFAMDVFPKLLASSIKVKIFPYSGCIIDIGKPHNLEKAEIDIHKPELGLMNP